MAEGRTTATLDGSLREWLADVRDAEGLSASSYVCGLVREDREARGEAVRQAAQAAREMRAALAAAK